jgi:hypothetical protein
LAKGTKTCTLLQKYVKPPKNVTKIPNVIYLGLKSVLFLNIIERASQLDGLFVELQNHPKRGISGDY